MFKNTLIFPIAMKRILAGIALFAYACAPPKKDVNLKEILLTMNVLKASYENFLKDAQNLAEDALEDNLFSESEQKSIYDLLKSAEETYDRHCVLAEQCLEKPAPLNDLRNSIFWYDALKQNVAGFDDGTPELQKLLSEKHPGIRVYAIESTSEVAAEAAAEAAAAVLDAVLSD